MVSHPPIAIPFHFQPVSIELFGRQMKMSEQFLAKCFYIRDHVLPMDRLVLFIVGAKELAPFQNSEVGKVSTDNAPKV